jgi:threonine/homoserine/homoserine lactone efflux protein
MGLLLAFVHDMEGPAWFTLLICGAHNARRWLGSRMVHRAVDGITGAVLVGFGLKLALSRR